MISAFYNKTKGDRVAREGFFFKEFSRIGVFKFLSFRSSMLEVLSTPVATIKSSGATHVCEFTFEKKGFYSFSSVISSAFEMVFFGKFVSHVCVGESTATFSNTFKVISTFALDRTVICPCYSLHYLFLT